MEAILGTSIGVFVGLTVIIAGGAAIMTGRALADGWKPAWQVVSPASASLSGPGFWSMRCSRASF